MKTIKFFLAAVLIGGGVYFTANQMKAQANEGCRNGCVNGEGGCFCYKDYPQFAEYNWDEDGPDPEK